MTFARVASTRPDAIAVRSGAREVTYAEVDLTSNVWAASLRHRGVAPADIVAIALPRGVDLILAILAVLKCGAAYAVVDPAWPRGRIESAMAVMRAKMLLTAPGVLPHPGALNVDKLHNPVAGFRPHAVRGSGPACVFFTSGTTGQPKSVLVPHVAVARLLQDNSFLDMRSPLVVPLGAPPQWDAFALELWTALLSGGTSVVVQEPFLSAVSLRSGVRDRGVDTAWMTSSIFNLLTEEDLDAFAGLDTLMIGGERLSTQHVKAFLSRHPNIRLLNGYGPVESAVFVTTHEIVPQDCDRQWGIPVGRPVPGTQILVLDGDRLCEVGEVGEICAAGEGLAIEYLGDPERTSLAFPRIVVEGRSVRVYRTGDLGVWSEDGVLEFRGRRDRQVKVRGVRVEPAEVERQVEMESRVERCHVSPVLDALGAVVDLAAFCVPTNGSDDLADLRLLLVERMTPHQMPGRVVPVRSIPLNDRGKVDERSLQELLLTDTRVAMDGEATEASGTRVAGGGTMEDIVAACVAEILGMGAPPRDVSFFRLGGSSLAAGRVCARLTALIEHPVPLGSIYQHPTVTELADAITASLVEPTVDVFEGELSPMQTLFLVKHLADPADPVNVCLLMWEVNGTLDPSQLQAAINHVHERHEALSSLYTLDPEPMALPGFSAPPELRVLEGRPDREAALCALTDGLRTGLDPLAAKLWRVAMVRSGKTVFLGCAVHHIAFDGFSERIFARDLAAAYNGAADALPRIPLGLRSGRLSGSASVLAAAKAELEGVPAISWPQGDFASASRSCRARSVSLPPLLVGAVDLVAARADRTRFVVLLACWARALAEVVGQEDLAVGVPVAQRDGPSLEHAVGCYMATVPVRLRGPGLQGDLEWVNAATDRAFARQDAPLTAVVAGATSHGRPPVFQTLFALQDFAEPRLDLAQATTRFLRQPYLNLTLELHAEVWVRGSGLEVVVSYLPHRVLDDTVVKLLSAFVDALERVAAPSDEPSVLGRA